MADWNGRILRLKDIQELWRQLDSREMRDQCPTLQDFMNWLERKFHLQLHRFEFPHRPETRYSFGPMDTYRVVASLHPAGFFSHGSAALCHGVRSKRSTIYFNVEQTKKPAPSEPPTQERIDRALAGKPRSTNEVARYKRVDILLLSGKHTGRLGATIHQSTSADSPFNGLTVTDPERTLIDLAVRPFYGGGCEQVLRSYRALKHQVDGQKVADYLSKIGYAYPFHQCLGFYMSRAGFDSKQIAPIAAIPRRLHFYLDYGLQDAEFDHEWQVHFPRALA